MLRCPTRFRLGDHPSSYVGGSLLVLGTLFNERERERERERACVRVFFFWIRDRECVRVLIVRASPAGWLSLNFEEKKLLFTKKKKKKKKEASNSLSISKKIFRFGSSPDMEAYLNNILP